MLGVDVSVSVGDVDSVFMDDVELMVENAVVLPIRQSSNSTVR